MTCQTAARPSWAFYPADGTSRVTVRVEVTMCIADNRICYIPVLYYKLDDEAHVGFWPTTTAQLIAWELWASVGDIVCARYTSLAAARSALHAALFALYDELSA